MFFFSFRKVSQSDDLPFFCVSRVWVVGGEQVVMGYHSVGFLVTGGCSDGVLVGWLIGYLVICYYM